MYLKHFGLSQKPFSLIPDPEFIHFFKKHQIAYSMLEYGLFEQTGITLMTGEVGSGKTTLLHHLLNEIDQHFLTIGLINNTHKNLGSLTHWIALAFGIPHENKDKVTLYHNIQTFIINQYAQKKRCVIIIDEAQNMDQDSLEELRLFTNINSNKDYLLQILLIGQPELVKTLEQPALAQIAQRISVEYHLGPLSFQETCEYINHRLTVAGAENNIISKDAGAVIFYHTAGTPRLINTLCDTALAYAYAKDETNIGVNTIIEVVNDRRVSGINRFANQVDVMKKIQRYIAKKTGIQLEPVA